MPDDHETVTAHRSGPGGVLLFDAECVLCNRFARFVIRHDPQGLFVLSPKTSPAGTRFLADLGIESYPPDTILLLHQGRLYYYSDVSFMVMGALGFPWSLARLFLFVPRFFRDRVYLLISRNRLRLFGRTTACGLLSAEERQRVVWE